VSKILSLRDSSIALQALDFNRKGCTQLNILKLVVNYASSHNVQQLGLYVRFGVNHDIAQILSTVFSCQTLTHLKLSIWNGRFRLFPKSLSLPALTNLQLKYFTFCVGDNDRIEPFSTFNRLNSLCISNCNVSGTQALCISSATLVNLTLHDSMESSYKIDLCTPCLSTFVFTGYPFHKISGFNVSSLKHVDIDAYTVLPPLLFIQLIGFGCYLFSWLQEFGNIKSLTVSVANLQVP
jgi:hypothetical protein